MTDHPETARLTADVVALAQADDTWHVLLIKRGWPPYAGRWALPGGHVDVGEEIDHAARRELLEETGIDVADLDLVGVYAAPGRDPRGRYVTWAYASWLTDQPQATAGDDARDARWWPLADALARPLAFDHRRIIRDAVEVHRHVGRPVVQPIPGQR
jgi:8-oxo-dGTP diphosphatase